jgi:hypothetical protein
MMGLLDPRLMAFLQQRGIQPPTNMGAPPMPRVNRPVQPPKPMMPNPIMTAPGFPTGMMNPGMMNPGMMNPGMMNRFVPAQMNMQVDPRAYAMPPRTTVVPAQMNMQVDPRSYVMPRR